MDWVWVHPYERGTGLFRQAWNEMEQLYGLFHIDGPYSASMSTFLRARQIHPVEPSPARRPTGLN